MRTFSKQTLNINMGNQSNIFDALGTLDTVLSRLRQSGLVKEAAALHTTISGVLDRVIERGDNLRSSSSVAAALGGAISFPQALENSEIREWLTASEPELVQTNSDKKVWISRVSYKEAGKQGMRLLILGTAPNIRPRNVVVNGKQLPTYSH